MRTETSSSGQAAGEFRRDLGSCGIALSYAFDPIAGLVRTGFKNTVGSRPVCYFDSPQSIYPLASEKYEPGAWTLERASVRDDSYGGMPVISFEAAASTAELRLHLRAVAFPGSPVIREWVRLENISLPEGADFKITPLRLSFTEDDRADTYFCTCFRGGMADYDHGMIRSEAMGVSPELFIKSHAHHKYVPLMLMHREGEPRDGFMAAIDCGGIWTLDVSRKEGGIRAVYAIDPERPLIFAPGETIEMPAVTFAAFAGTLDDFMLMIYDWQYAYQWDYTNPDYFGKTKMLLRWAWNNRNLHEQFAMRLAYLDMQANLAQEAGYDMIWDDAGWSAHPSDWPPDHSDVFFPSNEGPDFRHSQRYFKKCGLGWLLWFSRKQSLGLLESKQGAWGPFEYRTDAISVGNVRTDPAFKRLIMRFLENDPRRSFHTCSGGGTYCHTFDMQRIANYHYEADIGAGPAGNYYFSYFEVPDRTGDLQCGFGPKYLARDGRSILPPAQVKEEEISYVPEFARARLGCVPLPGPMVDPADIEAARVDLEIYRYLTRRGVAGRDTYVFHPVVYGDREYYFMQRTSHDRTRACVILRHTPKSPVTLFLRGLLPDHPYHVSFMNRADSFTAPGAQLMDTGIFLKNITDGELIFLNMPDHPGSRVTQAPPAAPGNAVMRLESNNGHTGVGIYWSPSPSVDDLSYYEVARDGAVIARVSRGNYTFDFSAGWDAEAAYSVRAVDMAGKRGEWLAASPIAGEPLIYSALGGIYSEPGFNGWTFEASADLVDFAPMQWVPPEKSPSGDLGGTPNQPGGLEGWWEFPGTCARVGRGWQQASPSVYCVRTFTAPRAGEIHITGRAMKEWYHSGKGTGQRVRIMFNDSPLAGGGWAPLELNDLYGYGHDSTVSVRKGDKLRFIADKCTGSEAAVPWDQEAGIIGWIPRIEYLSAAAPAPADDAYFRLRVNCGGDRPAEDESGNIWEADCGCSGGEAVTFDADDAILRTGRAGEKISYVIPAPNGIYTVQLTFAEYEYKWRGEREFNVAINGETVADRLDIAGEIMGARKRYVRTYNYVVPGADGNIRVELTAVKGLALIQALEVATEQRSAVRINCGGGRFIDWLGIIWEADRAFAGDSVQITADGPVAQATPTLYDRGLYLTGRAGRSIEYGIPVDDGIYSVHLKFAEMWLEQPGKRPVTVRVNGVAVKSGWDIYEAAQATRMAFDLRFDGISPVNGKIAVSIEADGENPAVIQGLEID